MKAEDIKIAEKIIDKHAEFTDHYADQEYTKEGILKMMEEYTLYTGPVSELTWGDVLKKSKKDFHEYCELSGTKKSVAIASVWDQAYKCAYSWMQQRQVTDKWNQKLMDDAYSYLSEKGVFKNINPQSQIEIQEALRIASGKYLLPNKD